jgi:ABC-type lipoprotein export system ATPase subunit
MSHHGQPVPVLSDVTLAAEAGAVTVLVGSSGSGKSTLLAICAMLLRPQVGEVIVNGHAMSQASDRARTETRRRAIGFVFQSSLLIPQMTALENVTAALPPGLPGGRARALHLLDSVGLADRANHLPGQLSGGQSQRAAVCRALANEPALVLADEPTGSLDLASADSIRTLLRSAADAGAAVLVATHDPVMVQWADRVQHLEHGQLTTRGPLHPPLSTPGNAAGRIAERAIERTTGPSAGLPVDTTPTAGSLSHD